MEEARVAIGLCVKNCERTIKESIDGVAGQDFPHQNIEVIVVDGESKDKTVLLAKDLLSKTDLHFKICSDGGRGLGVARQMVIDNSNGKYVLQLDGDIALPNDYVRKQVGFMEENPVVGMVRGKWKMPGKGSLVAFLESMRLTDYKARDPKKTTFPNLTGNAGSVYRIEALKQIGKWDANISAGEDIDISIRLRLAGWLLALDHEVYHTFRQSWKDLWEEYSWWGYGMHYIMHKHKGWFRLWRFIPLLAFVEGLLVCSNAYRASHRKVVLLLPIQGLFKRTGWWCGFAGSHFGGYGHFQE